jgi:hypothetical protein
MSNEKHQDVIEPAQSSSESIDIGKADLEDGEVFRTGEGLVNFRTVSWIHTSVIFLKRKCTDVDAFNGIDMLTEVLYSHLRDWCSDHSIRHVHSWSLSRRHQRAWLAVLEHMVCPCSGTVQGQPPWLPQYCGHGTTRWRKSRQRDYWHLVPGRFHHRRRLRHGRCVNSTQCSVESLPLHKLLLHYRSAHGRSMRECPEIRKADLDHLGWLCICVYCCVHCRVSTFYRNTARPSTNLPQCRSDHTRSPSVSTPNWRLRLRIPCHR